MFNKKLIARIEELNRDIAYLSEEIWIHENPYGVVEKTYSMWGQRIIYKTSRNVEIELCNYMCLPKSLLGYKIKKNNNITYVVLEMGVDNGKPYKETYAIKENTCMKIERLSELDKFDVEVIY